MRAAIVALVTTVALLSSVVAAPRKVLVLPLDGSAPAAQRAQLNDTVARMAKASIDGDVTVGDTTFAETAAAVGCDPQSDECAETVRSTLLVDELVYGRADTENGTTTVTVKRASAGTAPTAQTATLAETDSGEAAEPALSPMFGGTAPIGPDAAGSGSGSGSVVTDAPKRRNFFDTRERKIGTALAGGGVIALVIGLSFWSSTSDLQGQIDNHESETLDDVNELRALEDRAAGKAMWGNIMVLAGLGLGGAGAYFLYKDHRTRQTTIAPAPVDAGTGMTLVLGGRW